MWLILILLAGGLIYYFFIRNKDRGSSTASFKESPKEILKRRYAAGEISKEEFERRKTEIES